jgi:hypothetical protein
MSSATILWAPHSSANCRAVPASGERLTIATFGRFRATRSAVVPSGVKAAGHVDGVGEANVSDRIKIIDDDGLFTHEAMKLTTELAAENGISASEARNVLAALERKGYQIAKPN